MDEYLTVGAALYTKGGVKKMKIIDAYERKLTAWMLHEISYHTNGTMFHSDVQINAAMDSR